MSKKTQSLRIDDRTRMAIKADGTKIPVIDGKYSFLIQPSKEDIENAVPGDHANCMYCVTCRRLYGSELVWITRGLAYVELRGRGGKPQLQRYVLTRPAQKSIRGFDDDKQVTPEAVIFAAPRGHRRLDYQSVAYKRYKEKVAAGIIKPQKAYVSGHAAPDKKKPQPVGTLRSRASGMFQFQKKHDHVPHKLTS